MCFGFQLQQGWRLLRYLWTESLLPTESQECLCMLTPYPWRTTGSSLHLRSSTQLAESPQSTSVLVGGEKIPPSDRAGTSHGTEVAETSLGTIKLSLFACGCRRWEYMYVCASWGQSLHMGLEVSLERASSRLTQSSELSRDVQALE